MPVQLGLANFYFWGVLEYLQNPILEPCQESKYIGGICWFECFWQNKTVFQIISCHLIASVYMHCCNAYMEHINI